MEETHPLSVPAGPTLITILDRTDAESYVPRNRPALMISVTDPYSEPCSFDERDYNGIVRMQFEDVREECLGGMTPRHGTTVAAFLFHMRQLGIAELVIHCEWGISRSAGIALAACRILGLDEAVCFAGDRVPNTFVTRTVLESYAEITARAEATR